MVKLTEFSFDVNIWLNKIWHRLRGKSVIFSWIQHRPLLCRQTTPQTDSSSERQTAPQTDRQLLRQTAPQTDRQLLSQTESSSDRQTTHQTNRQLLRQTDSSSDRQTAPQTDRQLIRHTLLWGHPRLSEDGNLILCQQDHLSLSELNEILQPIAALYIYIHE